VVNVTVRFMSIARLRAGTAGAQFSSLHSSLGEVLKEIVDKYKITDIILNEKLEVRAWARVLVNGRSQEFVGGLDAELHDGDRIVLVYPYTENF
jgi:molybdopterin converting factor small subunit